MPHYIHPDQDTFSIRPSKAKFKGCQLLIVVHSALEAFHQRQSVRETWIHDFVKYRQQNQDNKIQNVSVIFLVGNQNGFGNFTLKSRLLEESAKFDDILQADMVDHYNNLTLKSVFTLKFFLNTSNFDTTSVPPFYLMKVDNDVYLNVPQLVRLLEDKKLTRSPMFLVGHRYITLTPPHTTPLTPSKLLVHTHTPLHPTTLVYPPTSTSHPHPHHTPLEHTHTLSTPLLINFTQKKNIFCSLGPSGLVRSSSLINLKISGLVPAKNRQHQYECQKVEVKSRAKLRVNGGYPSTSLMGPATPS